MKADAAVDFTISDMSTLKSKEKIKGYGEHSSFPVFAKG